MNTDSAAPDEKKGNPMTGDAYVIEGKLALPYTYFAGQTGSRFLIGIRDERQIRGLHCTTCNKVMVPPRAFCDTCMADLREAWVALPGTGRVVNHTVIRYQDHHLPKAPPYVLAMIHLDGCDTPIAHILEGVAPEAVEQGMAVRPVFSDQATNTILDIDHFEPAVNPA